MTSRYKDAVALATDFFVKQLQQGRLLQHPIEPTTFLYHFGLNLSNHWDDHPLCGSHYSCTDLAFRYLFMQSEKDKGAHDLASRIVGTKLLRSEPLSEAESFFAGQVLVGLRPCPPPEGKRLAASFAQNVHLVFLAQGLVKGFGLQLTRNEEAKSAQSACDAVSEALCNVGISKSWRAVKELLTHKSSQRVRDIVDAVEHYLAQARTENTET